MSKPRRQEVKLLERQTLAAGDCIAMSRTMFDKPISVRCDEDLVIDYDKGSAYTEKRDDDPGTDEHLHHELYELCSRIAADAGIVPDMTPNA